MIRSCGTTYVAVLFKARGTSCLFFTFNLAYFSVVASFTDSLWVRYTIFPHPIQRKQERVRKHWYDKCRLHNSLLRRLELTSIKQWPPVFPAQGPVSQKPLKLFGPVKWSGTLRLQSCFIHIFLIWTEVSFKQEVSGAYTSPVFRCRWTKNAFTGPKSSRLSVLIFLPIMFRMKCPCKYSRVWHFCFGRHWDINYNCLVCRWRWSNFGDRL